ncbi:hypothetical protein F5Y13DRAFT_207170 [Hypoxylon sp. FL1857]|nr:hypothetical protein F5Y13DRAFT_207170 [Hypoxylon sp. FL1857]
MGTFSSSSAPLLTGGEALELPRESLDDVYLSFQDETIKDSLLPQRLNCLSMIFRSLTLTLATLSGGQPSINPSQASPFSLLHQHKSTYEIDVYRPDTLPTGLSLCDCGRTIREALLRDCVYDTLSTAWLPPYCRDDELTAEFDEAGPGPQGEWGYFADEEGTIPLNRTEVAALGETDGSFWASHDWHVVHCLFYWQKYHRMRDTGVVMEERFDSLRHVKHCGRLIRNPTPDHFFLIEVPVMMNSSKDA